MTEETPVVETETPNVSAEPEVEVETKPRGRKTPVIRDHDDAILELRKENEGLRKKLDEIADVKARGLAEEQIKEARREAAEAAEEKLAQRLAELDVQSRARIVKSELKAAAARAGVIDFADLYAIMQHDLGKVAFGDDGEVANASELIAEIKGKKAHLFAGVSTASTTTPPPAREHVVEKPALQMTQAEYKAARARLVRM